jgi:HEAT repeat protein
MAMAPQDQPAWVALTHAYGSAADVPEHLADLTAADPAIRQAAYQALESSLSHQGTRYEASAPAATALIELAADPGVPDRAALLELLVALAIGYELWYLPDPFPIQDKRRRVAREARMTIAELRGELEREAAAAPTAALRRQLERDLEDFDEFDEFAWQRDLRRWALAAYDAVRQGVPTYVAALDAPQPEVRSRAASLLGWFPEERAVALGPLVRLLTAERDPAVAATAAIAAGLLGAGDGDRVVDRVDAAAGAGAGGDGDAWEMLDRRLGDPERVVRWAAGIGLGRLRPVPGERAVAELYACVGHRGPLPAEAAAVPYLEGDLVGLAAGVLGELDAVAAPQRLDALLDLAVVWPGPEEWRFPTPLVRAILKIAFPVVVPDGIEFADLSAIQRRVVSVLVTATNVFQWSDTGEQLVEHGLPGDPEHLRAYAGLG